MHQTRSASHLLRLITAILLGAGASSHNAGIVARSVVGSNLAGHDSHGVVRIPGLVRDALSGKLKPAANPFIVQEHGGTAVVDGATTFGHVGSLFATELAIAKARQVQISGVALGSANHTGRLGEWAELGAQHGYITLVTGSRANSSRGTPGGTLAPFGGTTGALATSPIAWSIPRRDGRAPVLLDFATSAVAQGKLQLAQASGDDVPLGWIIDSQGRPSTKVADFFAGGSQLPFGGHKGYALAVVVSLLSIGLSAGDMLEPHEHGSCLFISCIAPEAFRPEREFVDHVEKTIERIKSVRPADGFDEVLIPGEPEERSRLERSRDGIPIPGSIWDELLETAATVGVEAES